MPRSTLVSTGARFALTIDVLPDGPRGEVGFATDDARAGAPGAGAGAGVQLFATNSVTLVGRRWRVL